MLDRPQPVKPLISIEYVHDVICSWCPIGFQNISRAVDSLRGRIDVELKFLPYELNPDMPPEGETIGAHLQRRNGWSKEQLEDYAEMVVKKAASAGLIYDYAKRTHYYNTAKAHRLIDLAEQDGQQVNLVRALTNAYFRDGVDISDTGNLIDIAGIVGLDPVAVHAALAKERPSAALREKYRRVRSLEIKSVPSMLIDGRTFVQGSNSPEFFSQLCSDLAHGSAISAANEMQ